MSSPAQHASTRISRTFAALREKGELGLVAYVTAGDPTLHASEQIILAIAEAGADLIELGVPFSDPVADGPVIQRASERALRAGATLAGIMGLVQKLRAKTQVPLILFSYLNPVLQTGIDRFADAASRHGADGVLVTDLPPEEADQYCAAVRGAGLDTVFLAAPTSTQERLVRIAAASSGFLYLISRTGVTGAKNELPEDLPALVRRARAVTSLPLAVGFGISLPGHVSVLGGLADAAVVGSALVSAIENSATPGEAASAAAGLVRRLKSAARTGMSRRESAL